MAAGSPQSNREPHPHWTITISDNIGSSSAPIIAQSSVLGRVLGHAAAKPPTPQFCHDTACRQRTGGPKHASLSDRAGADEHKEEGLAHAATPEIGAALGANPTGQRILGQPNWGPLACSSACGIREGVQRVTEGAPGMEIWFDGSSDGYRAAWAAVILEDGEKPRLVYGIGFNVISDSVDRWAARLVLRRLQDRIAAANHIVLVSDRQDNVTHPVNRDSRLEWLWRSRRHPLIQQLDHVANDLRRALPLPTFA